MNITIEGKLHNNLISKAANLLTYQSCMLVLCVLQHGQFAKLHEVYRRKDECAVFGE